MREPWRAGRQAVQRLTSDPSGKECGSSFIQDRNQRHPGGERQGNTAWFGPGMCDVVSEGKCRDKKKTSRIIRDFGLPPCYCLIFSPSCELSDAFFSHKTPTTSHVEPVRQGSHK
ncbi:unnamed protein product [Pleuronectes platessa]|uniref:Uncharacterized protein n=1 Tax=Pleuronectes platessa TaxID=8262 RepID=A0A9N7UAU6_PLEPL|nr:unnamed protein product [Pleuronectes platessa]